MSQGPGLHTLGEVRQLTGLSDRRIRYYEHLGLLEPLRSPGRQRLFTSADVKRLLDIKHLLDEGASLRHIRQRLTGVEGEAADDAESGDAASHFRGVAWVRGGQSGRPGLHRLPDPTGRFDEEGE